MLKITIAQRGFAAVDITDRLDNDSDPVLDSIRERNAFKRAFADVTLRLNNLDRYFTQLFLSKHPSTWWEFEVWVDGRRNFVGRIATPIKFNLKEEWVTITVFDINKLFWERAAVTPISFYPEISASFIRFTAEFDTVEKLLHTILLRTEKQPLRSIGVSVIEIDSMYVGKPTDPYPGERRLKESTTIEALLLAMAIYYNAEFFIDPTDFHFKMKHRQTVLNDRRINIDDILQDDAEISVQDSDEENYDYIHVLRAFDRADTPTITTVIPAESGIEKYIGIQYCMTNLISYDGVKRYESEPSYPTEIKNAGETPVHVLITLPPAGQYVVGRVLYRALNAELFKKVAVISNNTQTIYTDNLPSASLAAMETMVVQQRPLHVWYRYDETTGNWLSPVISQDSDDAPEGRIFEVTPKLEFIDVNGKNSTSNITDAFRFFGNEQEYESFIERWKPIFLTHRKVNCTLRGKNFAVGDSLISSGGLFPNDFTVDPRMVMKNPKIHLVKEFTEAELFTI